MNENLKIVFGLLGGLSLFLFGMNSMSDALQKAAGEKMKKVLSFLTRNPVMGALAGALVTAVLQSSSATTVMVIGFVSAGLMTLPQAISVIFGANIGTTMTAQLLAFKISDYIYPIIFIGFILSFLSKKEKVKSIGLVMFYFGLLFEGIEIMGGVMKPLASSAFFVDLMAKVKDIPVLGVFLGAGMTLVVQSSSATIAVLQNFAQQAGPGGASVIGLTGAIPILLGDNIGTTITALLASIGQSKDAKRTAIAHSTFNITGSIVFLFLIHPLARFITWISPKGAEVDVISRQIANAHTTFNVVCTLIWLPLIPLMVKIVTFIIKGKDKVPARVYDAKFLDERMIGQPVAAMHLVSEEITRSAENVYDMITDIKELVKGKETKVALEKYQQNHETVKELQEHISSYIAKMFSSGNLTEKQSEKTAGLLFVSNNLDRISDRCKDVQETIQKLSNNKEKLSGAAVSELTGCLDIASDLFQEAMEAVATGNSVVAEKVIKGKMQMMKVQKKNNKAHLARVKRKECSGKLTSDYSGMLYNIERIAEGCAGIAEEALDAMNFHALQIEGNNQKEAVIGAAVNEA